MDSGNIFIHTFESEILKRSRRIRIYTPPGFNKDKVYPLLVQHDGQLIFSDRDSQLPYGSWRVDKWIEQLMHEKGFSAPIVVGIDNSPKRMKEYFPVTTEYENYRQFIIEELLPWVESHYPVDRDPANRALMGSSMGGLVSFALAWELPHLFSKAACLSPWFEYENNKYIHEVLRKANERSEISVYLDSGIRDWRHLDDGHRGMLLARLELIRLGFEEGQNLDLHVDTWFPSMKDLEGSLVREDKYREAVYNQHNEFQWNRRLQRPLEFLFGA